MEQNADSKDDGLACRHCGGKFTFVSSNGPTTVYRCTLCGHEQAFHIVPPVEDFYRSLGPRGTLRVRWSADKPPAKEASALRQLVPELRDLSIRDVAKRIEGMSEWVFTELTRGQAEDLHRRVISLGLQAIVEFPETE
jgi:DNA-directed RNA polymerase subunit RPC12/RpoP